SLRSLRYWLGVESSRGELLYLRTVSVETEPRVELALSPGSCPTPSCDFAGTVLDSNALAVDGLSVTMQPEHGAQGSRAAVTSAGRFHFVGLSPQPYSLEIRRGEQRLVSVVVNLATESAREITVP